MTAPDIKETVGGYELSWSDHQVMIVVTRVRDDHERLTGEVAVRIFTDKWITIYPPTQVNFLADRTRTSLAKALSVKAAKIPWSQIIDQLCYGVQDRQRKGNPVITLTSGDDVKPPEYLCYPLVVAKQANVLFGDPGALKSNLSIYLSQIIMLPWIDNPLKLIPRKESVKTLYLDWENDDDTVRWQLTTIQRGHELAGLDLPYRKCALPLADDLAQIKQYVVDTKAELVIIDSLGLAAGGELVETRPALAYFAALRQLHVTSVTLAHNSKDRIAKQRTIYGNQMFTAQARNIWECRKSQEQGSAEADVALFHRKPPPFGSLHSPIGFHFTFGIDTMKAKASNPKDVAEFTESMPVSTQILTFLERGLASPGEIAEGIGVSANAVYQAILRLKKSGSLTSIGKQYGLPANRNGEHDEN